MGTLTPPVRILRSASPAAIGVSAGKSVSSVPHNFQEKRISRIELSLKVVFKRAAGVTFAIELDGRLVGYTVRG